MTTKDEARGAATVRPDDGDVFKIVLDKVKAANNALIAEGVLPAGIDQSRVVVEPPRDPTHGDVATNSAMVLAKDAGRKPRELAEAASAKAAPSTSNMSRPIRPAPCTSGIRAAPCSAMHWPIS